MFVIRIHCLHYLENKTYDEYVGTLQNIRSISTYDTYSKTLPVY